MSASDDVARAFEEHVAKLYEALGYSVKHNIILSGQQIDLLISKIIRGIGRLRIAVECKFRSARSVSNQQVYDFIAMIKSISESEELTAGIMVTNTSFSAAAKSAAESTGLVRLLLAKSLEEEFFDVQGIYRAFVQNYETSNIYHNYIPLRALNTSDVSFLPRGDLSHVERELLRWIAAPSAGFVSILGDYGAGKTTLLDRLKYDTAKAYLDGTGTIRPFMILLRDYFHCGSPESLLRFSLQREFGQDIPLPVFRRALANGQLLVLLDGFDEMTRQTDKEQRTANMLSLAPLLTSTSKAILTCRPAYFVSAEEYNNAIDAINFAGRQLELTLAQHDIIQYRATRRRRQPSRRAKRVDQAHQDQHDAKRDAAEELRRQLFVDMIGHTDGQRITSAALGGTITLKGLDEDQIDRFLQQHNQRFRMACGHDWKEVRAFLFKVYDLRDLMRRPILLTMITATVLSGKVDVSEQDVTIGAAELYEIYTSMQFDWDWHKGRSRQFLSKEQRRQFAQALALAMFEKGRLEVTYRDIHAVAEETPDLLRDVCERLSQITTEQVASDIQTCTFLSRTDENLFRFAHKSFMEFFLARHLKAAIAENKTNRRLLSPLPREIYYFLGSFCNFDPSLWDHFLEVLESREGRESQDLRNNMASSMLFSGGEVPQFKIRKCRIRAIDVVRAIMAQSTLKEVVMESVKIEDWSSHACSFTRTELMEADVNGWTSVEDTVDLNLVRTQIRRWDCSRCQLRLRGRQSLITGARLSNTSIEIMGNLELNDITVTKGSLQMNGVGAGPLTVNESQLHGTKLRAARGGLRKCTVSASECHFSKESQVEDSVFHGGTLEGMGAERRLVDFAGCTLHKTKVQVAHSGFHRCEARDMELEGVSIRMTTCHIRGGRLLLSGSSLMDDCTLSHAIMRLQGDTDRSERVSKTTFSEVACDAKAGHLEDCQFDGGALRIWTRTLLKGCRATGTSVTVEGSHKDRSELEECRLKGCNVRIEGARVRASRFSDVEGQMDGVDLAGCEVTLVSRDRPLTISDSQVVDVSVSGGWLVLAGRMSVRQLALKDVTFDVRIEKGGVELGLDQITVSGGSVVGVVVDARQLVEKKLRDFCGVLLVRGKREELTGSEKGDVKPVFAKARPVARVHEDGLYIVPLYLLETAAGREKVLAELRSLEKAGGTGYAGRLASCLLPVTGGTD